MASFSGFNHSITKRNCSGPYKDTVRLPTTKFGMRANSRQREPALQEQWSRMGLYETLSRENPGEAFTIHDGPPYANGDLHMGHALNKVVSCLSYDCTMHSLNRVTNTHHAPFDLYTRGQCVSFIANIVGSLTAAIIVRPYSTQGYVPAALQMGALKDTAPHLWQKQ